MCEQARARHRSSRQPLARSPATQPEGSTEGARRRARSPRAPEHVPRGPHVPRRRTRHYCGRVSRRISRSPL